MAFRLLKRLLSSALAVALSVPSTPLPLHAVAVTTPRADRAGHFTAAALTLPGVVYGQGGVENRIATSTVFEVVGAALRAVMAALPRHRAATLGMSLTGLPPFGRGDGGNAAPKEIQDGVRAEVGAIQGEANVADIMPRQRKRGQSSAQTGLREGLQLLLDRRVSAGPEVIPDELIGILYPQWPDAHPEAHRTTARNVLQTLCRVGLAQERGDLNERRYYRLHDEVWKAIEMSKDRRIQDLFALTFLDQRRNISGAPLAKALEQVRRLCRGWGVEHLERTSPFTHRLTHRRAEPLAPIPDGYAIGPLLPLEIRELFDPDKDFEERKWRRIARRHFMAKVYLEYRHASREWQHALRWEQLTWAALELFAARKSIATVDRALALIRRDFDRQYSGRRAYELPSEWECLIRSLRIVYPAMGKRGVTSIGKLIDALRKQGKVRFFRANLLLRGLEQQGMIAGTAGGGLHKTFLGLWLYLTVTEEGWEGRVSFKEPASKVPGLRAPLGEELPSVFDPSARPAHRRVITSS